LPKITTTRLNFKHIVVIFRKQRCENAVKLLMQRCPPQLINVATLPCKMKCSYLVYIKKYSKARMKKKALSDFVSSMTKSCYSDNVGLEVRMPNGVQIQNVHRLPDDDATDKIMRCNYGVIQLGFQLGPHTPFRRILSRSAMHVFIQYFHHAVID